MPTLHELWEDLLSEKNALLTDLTNLKEYFSKDIENLLAKPGLIMPLFQFLREHDPMFRVGELAIVSRYDDVLEVLGRNAEFSVTEIYEAKMIRTTGPFVLGMADDAEYERLLSIMQSAIRSDDLDRIRSFAADAAQKLVEEGVQAGNMDVVGGLSKVVPSLLVGHYFGTPGPDMATLQRWMRSIFRDIFLNLANDGGMMAEADASAAELHIYLDQLIAERTVQLTADPNAEDDFLSRLVGLELETPGSIGDDLIRELVGGTIVGAVDTNSKAIAQAFDQLLNRPDELRLAQAAARSNDPSFSKYVFEALRFNPQNPFLIRHSEADTVIAAGTPRERTIPKGTIVIVGTWSAMFDFEKVEDPGSFKIDRPDDVYLHFGFGQHTCFGQYISKVLIVEVMKALLAAASIQRVPGDEGQILYDGAFPDRLIVSLVRFSDA